MKLISWNVNGLRACIQKGFLEQFQRLDADFFCLQETKLQPGQLELNLPGYEQYWCYAEKKGYSGTAIFTKHTPLSVSYGIGVPELDNEGRVITLEYPEFYLLTCYTPNAQRGLARIEHRMRWDEAFRCYIKELDSRKPTILCGDLNVAHKEIDLKNPGSNRGNAGFSDEERESFTKTLNLGFTDTFRHLHPEATGAYTWWSYMFHARENNAGWRIDYFLVSDRIRDSVFKTPIYHDIMGSDHCPVGLELDIKCNGGIWSPECIDLTPPKAEEKEPEGKIAAPAIKAGAIAILVLCLLIGGVLLTNRSTSTDDPMPTTSEYVFLKLATVHVYDSPLQEAYIWQDPTQSALIPTLSDGEKNWWVGDEDKYFDIRLNHRPINFWIRIDLTEIGRENIRFADDFMFVFTPQASGYFENETYCTTTRRYFLEDGSMGGWFVYGFIPTVGYADISLKSITSTDGTPLYSEGVSPYIYPDAHPERLVSECIQNVELYNAYINAEDLPAFRSEYERLRESNDALKNLEYSAYLAAEFLYDAFLNNINTYQKPTAEALLSLFLYNNQLTGEQKAYLNENCQYHKEDRYERPPEIEIPG